MTKAFFEVSSSEEEASEVVIYSGDGSLFITRLTLAFFGEDFSLDFRLGDILVSKADGSLLCKSADFSRDSL